MGGQWAQPAPFRAPTGPAGVLDDPAIMFVLLFTYVFGGAISHSLPSDVSYVDYLLPGILVQSVTFRASMTAVGLSDDLKLGVIDRFRSMPMARPPCSSAVPRPTWSGTS
jgi:hypothetical protein